MVWIYLLVVGVLEIVWVFVMKQFDGFSKFIFLIIILVIMIVSFWLLLLVMCMLLLGIVYMIWIGIGVVGVFVVGIVFLGEQISVMWIGVVVLIVSGLVLMKVLSG